MQSLHTDQPFQLRYLVMPDYIYSDDRLTDVSRRVYSFIHSYKNPFFFGNEHLAEMFKCHAETISTAVKQLEKLGLIKTEYRVKAGGGKIRLCVDACSEPVSTLVRDEKNEPTNQSLHLDKDKDNNKKDFFEKEIPNNLDVVDPILAKRREKREKKKMGFSTAFGQPPSYKNSVSESKPRIGRSAEDIR